MLRHCLLFYLLLAFSFQSCSVIESDFNNTKPYYIAHRGASAYAPENTMLAIEYALKMDFDKIEIDVRLSKDGYAVLMHDKKINRTTNGKGRVNSYTLAELKEFDAGFWFSEKYKNQKVPELDEVIKLIDGQKPLLIEIKSENASYSKIVDVVGNLIIDNDALSWCIVQSFDNEFLLSINERFPQIRLQKLYYYKPLFIPIIFDKGIKLFSSSRYSFVESMNSHYFFTWRRTIRRLQRNGFEVYLWGGENPGVYRKSQYSTVNGVIVDGL